MIAAVGPLLTTLASATPPPVPLPESFPRGRIVENVHCRAAPNQSYALYLPPGYSAQRRWPILYALDARGRALLPAERFEKAAAAWGWIIASAYGTRSDEEDSEGSVEALRAIWNDTHERLAIDERRVYLTGFSGMARLSVALALNGRGAIAGVIGVGAGFPGEAPPRRDLGFPWFGAAGDRDFNFSEMRAVEALLENFGRSHRFVSFSGRHEWPPAEVCAEGVAWMEIQAAKRGTRPKEDPSLEELRNRRRDAAAALDSAGWMLEASRAYRNFARDFESLADVSREAARAEELERSDAVRRALREEDRLLATERAEVRKAEQTVRDAVNQSPLPPPAALARDLKISYWKDRASGGGVEALTADRILASLYVQTVFYLPQRFLAQGLPGKAALVLSVAAEIRPKEPAVWIELARAQAKGGNRGEARRSVQRALAHGADASAVKADPILAPLMADVPS